MATSGTGSARPARKGAGSVRPPKRPTSGRRHAFGVTGAGGRGRAWPVPAHGRGYAARCRDHHGVTVLALENDFHGLPDDPARGSRRPYVLPPRTALADNVVTAGAERYYGSVKRNPPSDGVVRADRSKTWNLIRPPATSPPSSRLPVDGRPFRRRHHLPDRRALPPRQPLFPPPRPARAHGAPHQPGSAGDRGGTGANFALHPQSPVLDRGAPPGAGPVPGFLDADELDRAIARATCRPERWRRRATAGRRGDAAGSPGTRTADRCSNSSSARS
jgi:hypothetical protein